MELYSIHLFAGAGGGILGDLLLGHTPICAVEIEEYPRRVLLQRQLDGVLPAFPIWDDITTFRSDNPESSAMFDCARGIRDRLVVCGGFPCQDISSAGKGAGIEGERSGLWCEMARVVREVRPRFVFVENSPLLVRRGLAVVLSDLAEMGFNATWCVLGAHHVGAPHKRDRIWILAHTAEPNDWACHAKEGYGQEQELGSCLGASDVPDTTDCKWRTKGSQATSGRSSHCIEFGRAYSRDKSRADWWDCESGISRVVDGVAFGMVRTSAIGNGQVPAVVREAFLTLLEASRKAVGQDDLV